MTPHMPVSIRKVKIAFFVCHLLWEKVVLWFIAPLGQNGRSKRCLHQTLGLEKRGHVSTRVLQRPLLKRKTSSSYYVVLFAHLTAFTSRWKFAHDLCLTNIKQSRQINSVLSTSCPFPFLLPFLVVIYGRRQEWSWEILQHKQFV